MLRDAVDATGIPAETAANLLGIHPSIFQEWVAEQRPIPSSYATKLSTIIGIDLLKVAGKKMRSREMAEYTPAIWYRFREKQLVSEDREYVFLIRQLGYYIHQLEQITETPQVGWQNLFRVIRDTVDRQAPPRVQGRQAAKMFREMTGLGQGASGIGEVLRGNLRSLGILVIESPIPESKLEGCCFFVGSRESYRPSVFANSHHSTWFRRNFVLVHEVAHAIFDAESAGATLDFFEDTELSDDVSSESDISEERADAFAQEVMVPAQVVKAAANSIGIDWANVSANDLAKLVASTHVEKQTLIGAMLAAELITHEQAAELRLSDIADILLSISDRALSAPQYLEKYGREHAQTFGNRDTETSPRKLRIPVAYRDAVVGLYQSGEISRGKAAEMLMIDESTFEERFGKVEIDDEFTE